ncbi:hypothetical protein [Vulcanisaeta souniana]|uniref:hypothetical protein n=1 Tax=Vulcanisaeta souniana TaxID=164452 RepID=UPI000B2F5634|nr:hypothetical protein [Vulcanisaeta souniana]
MSTEAEVTTTGVKVELPKSYEDIKDLIRVDRLPHIWCPGCGLGILLKLLARAIKNSGIPIEKHVIVTGIGCTGRLGGYLKLDAYHVTHGRAIPFAVGLKMANPELEVTWLVETAIYWLLAVITSYMQPGGMMILMSL